MTLPAAQDAEVILDPSISLKQFPPKLRKLGKYYLKNEKKLSITAACEELGLNRNSILTEIWRAKKNGNDFQRFIDTVSDTYLDVNLIAVDSSLVEGAVSGSHQHQKLYYERTKRLQENISLNINHLTIGVNIQGVNPQDTGRDKGVIDVEPIIPKKG